MKDKNNLLQSTSETCSLVCGAWAATKSDELKLATFERKILKRIYGPKINNEREYEIKKNQEIQDLYGEVNIG